LKKAFRPEFEDFPFREERSQPSPNIPVNAP
jgi:hypothetical protein